jgi:tetraacyldisaccharide 4'-kinase
MKLLSSLFGLGVQARNKLYDQCLLRAKQLDAPVVSVGNLSVGGSGKTPFVIMLGELLKARGIEFDVLSRGYGRRSQGVALVDPEGSPKEFGDEPLLIARRLGVPVIVAAQRYEAGILAESFSPKLHLLDDGFQHRSLARDFDIVLLTPEDVNHHLLPTGRLREPLSSLKRADAIVMTGDVSLASIPAEGKYIWRVRREIMTENVPVRPLVFCGIARPGAFISQLKAKGIEPAATVFLRDHHAYDEKDVERLLAAAKENKAQSFVTTEKDAINLGALSGALEPLTIVCVSMELENAADAVDTMLRVIAERGRAA